jgi:hypothetical protein
VEGDNIWNDCVFDLTRTELELLREAHKNCRGGGISGTVLQNGQSNFVEDGILDSALNGMRAESGALTRPIHSDKDAGMSHDLRGGSEAKAAAAAVSVAGSDSFGQSTDPLSNLLVQPVDNTQHRTARYTLSDHADSTTLEEKEGSRSLDQKRGGDGAGSMSFRLRGQ